MGLDTVEFVLWAENEFEVEISDQEASAIRTLEEFVLCVAAKSTMQYANAALLREAIYKRVVHRLATAHKVPLERIHPDAEFVKDLGLQ